MRRLISLLNAAFIVGILYMIVCVWQAINMPIDMTVISKQVYDTEGKFSRDLEEGGKVARGERVVVRFLVPGRDVSGWNHIERRLIDANGVDMIVSQANRTWKAKSPSTVLGEFPIPRHAGPGCGAVIFSVSSYTIRTNPITWVAPLQGASPRIRICLD